MIDFNRLVKNKDEHRVSYLAGKPFPYLVIDGFCEQDKIEELYTLIPEINTRSRDFVFANNKFEKSNYKELGSLFQELYSDLSSEKMKEFLSYISSKDIFVDPKNHGGGLHQGKENSYLDMHLDFNYHPINELWYREMNLLFYLNKDWKEEYRGHLKLEDLRTGMKGEVAVPFNRLVIQQCGPHTLHGYDQTNFPADKFRTSIATYAYNKHIRHLEKPRTTDWFPENSSVIRRIWGRNVKHLVKIKNSLLGSGTAKN